MVTTSPQARERLHNGHEGTAPHEPTDRRVTTTFRVTQHAINMLLVLRGDSGHTQMCSRMDPLGGDRWSLTVRLRPGRYGYRYYAIEEQLTTYVSPRDVEDACAGMNGLDAILVVP